MIDQNTRLQDIQLKDIQERWEQDCQFDTNNIVFETVNIGKLHSLYYRIFIFFNINLKKRENEYNVLKLEKHKFLTGLNASPLEYKKYKEMGWVLPPEGYVNKTLASTYLDADNDLNKKSLEIKHYKEIVGFLSSILDMLKNRGYLLKTALDDKKYKDGI